MKTAPARTGFVFVFNPLARGYSKKSSLSYEYADKRDTMFYGCKCALFNFGTTKRNINIRTHNQRSFMRNHMNFTFYMLCVHAQSSCTSVNICLRAPCAYMLTLNQIQIEKRITFSKLRPW